MCFIFPNILLKLIKILLFYLLGVQCILAVPSAFWPRTPNSTPLQSVRDPVARVARVVQLYSCTDVLTGLRDHETSHTGVLSFYCG